jgi:Rap1a immunity proteins
MNWNRGLIIMRHFAIFVFAATLGAAVQAQTNLGTGSSFYLHCNEAKGTQREICVAYLYGVAEGDHYWWNRGGSRPPRCGSNVTITQALDVLLSFLRDHPAERDKSIVELHVKAMSSAFPCPR